MQKLLTISLRPAAYPFQSKKKAAEKFRHFSYAFYFFFFSLSHLASLASLADNFLFHQHSRKERGWKEKRLMYYYSFLQCHRFRLRFDQIARNRMREKVTASIIFKNRKASYPKR